MNFIIEYWLQTAFGLLVVFAGYLYRQVKRYRNRLKTMESALIILLKRTIIDLYENVKLQDTITVNDKEKINQLYHEYEKFECCGIIQDLMANLEKKKIE